MNNIIVEIHKSFDTATNKCVLESKRLIKECDSLSVMENDIEKLSNLGFSNSKPVQGLIESKKKKISSIELLEEINFWGVNYPEYKFISVEQVNAIGEKYGLITVNSKNYVGGIPYKHIKEILDFKINDIHKSIYYHSRCSSYEIVPHLKIFDLYNKKNRNSIKPELLEIITRTRFTPKIQLDEVEKFNYWYIGSDYDCISDMPFMICCPPQDVFMTVEQRDSFFQGNKKVKIDDPIVLYPVRLGFLVVSKWGLEGDEDILKNQKLN